MEFLDNSIRPEPKDEPRSPKTCFLEITYATPSPPFTLNMGKSSEAAVSAVSDVTASALVNQGNEALARFNPELALQFFQRARTLEPSDPGLMDATAEIYLQVTLFVSH